MLVDPEILRAFAGQVDSASAAITAADVGTKISSAGDWLAGSTTQWAARSGGGYGMSKIGQFVGDVVCPY